MTKEVAKVPQERELFVALQSVDSQIKAVMPKSWDDEDFKRLLSSAAIQSRKWGRNDIERQEILANLDIGSFIEAVTTAASCHIIPDGRRGYLITRFSKAANGGGGGQTVTFQADYKGLMDCAKRSDPRILNIHADTIHANDVFEHCEGSSRRFEHSIPRDTLATGRGEMQGAYAIVYYKSGHYDVEVLALSDLKQIMACSSANYGPNRDWPLQMHRKAAIRRLCKRLPETPDLARLIDSDHALFDLGGEAAPIKEPAKLEVSDLPPVKVKKAKPAKKKTQPQDEDRKQVVALINKLYSEAQEKKVSISMNIDGDTLYDMKQDELEEVAEKLAVALEGAEVTTEGDAK